MLPLIGLPLYFNLMDVGKMFFQSYTLFSR